MNADNKYNGWTNWETWSVSLYYMDSIHEYTSEIREDDPDFEWTPELVEEYVADFESDCFGESDTASLMSQFYNGCMRSVNWHEIAEHANED